MAEKPAQEKTEQPTPKRLQQAREKGQVARSRELTTMVVLMVSAACLIMIGDDIISGLLGVMHDGFEVRRSDLMDANMAPVMLQQALGGAVLALLPFLLIVLAAALIAPLALSGWSFSVQAMAFKWDKLDPVKGLGRIFSARSLIELLKALAKFSVVLAIALVFLWFNVDTMLGLGTQAAETALTNAGSILVWAFLFLSCAMILIAAVDVPFQIWDHQRQLRMTRQEVKDELKETDGSPEMKRKVREVRNEIMRRRMMDAVPTADVVITNPTHYAVALKYDQAKMSAPVVVAKGKDLVALQIRNLAVEHKVPIISAPPLSRALFHSTELQQRIPAGLFLAVAQVLAYAYQLRRRPHRRAREAFDDLPIPDDLRVDE
jgi:flagellar biosynthesis protein FlhB